jgi:RNA polymerase-binding transcription factor DksA
MAKKKPVLKKPAPKSRTKKPRTGKGKVRKSAGQPAPKAKPAAKPKMKVKPSSRPQVRAPSPPLGKPAEKSPTMEKPSKKTALRDSILKRKAALKPIAFSLDEVRAIALTVISKTNVPFTDKSGEKAAAKLALASSLEKAKPQHVKAASLADILGFNPKKERRVEPMSDKDIPEKFKRYFRLLVELRLHLTEGIERHSEETLKRSAKDDTGDLSSYGQHMADAGTDTFDRDFALSMVASEQEALAEIDAAIKRINAGTYGICEITQKPIARDRLLAVPFTRHSAEAQKDIERNRHRSRTQAGLFGEMGDESGGGGGKMTEDDGGE